MAVTRVAIVQSEPAPSLDEGLQRTDALTREAARGGASLVVFPETWLPGYPAWLDVCRDVALWDHEPVKAVYARYAASSVDVTGESGGFLRDIARRHGVTLVVGTSERVASGPGRGTLYNALLVIGPGWAVAQPSPEADSHLHRAAGVGKRGCRRLAGGRHARGSRGGTGVLGALDATGAPGPARLG